MREALLLHVRVCSGRRKIGEKNNATYSWRRNAVLNFIIA